MRCRSDSADKRSVVGRGVCVNKWHVMIGLSCGDFWTISQRARNYLDDLDDYLRGVRVDRRMRMRAIIAARVRAGTNKRM